MTTDTDQRPATRPGYLYMLAFTCLIAIIFLAPLPDPVPSVTTIPAASVEHGVPATWDCSTPITWTFNPVGANPGTLEDITSVFDDYHRITGLNFRYDGTTTDIPQRDDLVNGANLTARPSDIVIAVAQPALSTSTGQTSTLLDTDDAGAAKTSTATEARARLGFIHSPSNRILAADIVLRPSADLANGDSYGGQSGQKAFLTHEIGHAVGLDHAEPFAASVMTPTLDGHVTTLQPLDTSALRSLYSHCTS